MAARGAEGPAKAAKEGAASGIATVPSVAAVATLEPDVAANNAQLPTLVCINPPGMLPSASLGPVGANGKQAALYEPVHDSAPDIVGAGIANPAAAILSVGMMLELSLGRADLAARVKNAVEGVIVDGVATQDLGGGVSGEFEPVFANRVAFVKSFRRFDRAGICVPAGFTLRSVVDALV